jgi:hypothetical protein
LGHLTGKRKSTWWWDLKELKFDWWFLIGRSINFNNWNESLRCFSGPVDLRHIAEYLCEVLLEPLTFRLAKNILGAGKDEPILACCGVRPSREVCYPFSSFEVNGSGVLVYPGIEVDSFAFVVVLVGHKVKL